MAMTEREKYQQIFEKELAKLNDEQRSAVEAIYGQVMVIAGPGTGKTQILAARIGNILTKTDVYPQNILCLTYTEAGAFAMRQRLKQFIGPDALKVTIQTFHGFCNAVIQENKSLFGIADLELVSDLEESLFLTEIIDGFSDENPLKKYVGDLYHYKYKLKNLYRNCKTENWNEEIIKKAAKAYLDDLPNRDEFIYKRNQGEAKKGDVNLKKIQGEVEKVEKLVAAAETYSQFNQRMKKNQRYDYQDMILWVINLFKTNEYLRARYQEQYQFILVDEFQDTSGAQHEILHYLTYGDDNPNLFVVGDDDQSIYGFQGAQMKRMVEFVQTYAAKDLKIVVLEKNYRSIPSVLATASLVIDHNQERLLKIQKELNLSKNILSAHPILSKDTGLVKVSEFQRKEAEEAYVVEQIQSLASQEIPYHEMAIIYRSHRDVAEIINVFRKRNIPYKVKLEFDVLKHPLITQLVKHLVYIHTTTKNPEASPDILFEILHAPWWKMYPKDIQRILAFHSHAKNESLRSLIVQEGKLLSAGVSDIKAFKRFDTVMMELTADQFNYTLQGWVEKLFVDVGILHYVIQHPEKVSLLEILHSFFGFIKAESAKRPSITLAQLVQSLEEMLDNQLPISLSRVFGEETGVHLLTAHGAKGLEYDHVFILKATEKHWEKKRAPNNEFFLPDTLISSVSGKNEEEERRLFYVAMTRAKKTLEITYAIDDNISPSRFVEEAKESPFVEFQYPEVSQETIFQYLADSLVQRPPSAVALEKGLLQKRLENYKLSVTHLNKYLKCPLTFYFENVINVPQSKNAAIGFGNAVHSALELLFKNIHNQHFPEVSTFLGYFEQAMVKNKDCFTDAEYTARMQFGKEQLAGYYEQGVPTWKREVRTEVRINESAVKNVPIKGVIDKIELPSSQANVVDYKTGNVTNAKKNVKGPDEINPLGGDYWRQIVFYKILLDNSPNLQYHMVSGEISCIVKDEAKQEYFTKKINPSPDDIRLVTEQIEEVYGKIMALEFDKGCNEPDCTWCNFVKNNYQSTPSNLEEEMELA